MRRRRPIPATWPVVPLILLYVYLALNSAIMDSPTMDEQNHLTRGLTLLATGDPRFSLEHPPLVNLLAALPVHFLMDIQLPLDHPSWAWREGWYAFADQLVWSGAVDVDRLFLLARLPMIWLTLGLALVAYRLAESVWSPGGRSRDRWLWVTPGLLAFAFVLFDPNVLAHGRLVTTDAGGAALILLATLALWRLWPPGPVGWRLLAAGIALGLAFAGKHSNLLFAPIFAVMTLLPREGSRAARLARLVAAGLISVPIVWLAYGLEWGPFRFLEPPLAALNTRSGPMPTYWAGLEQILAISGGGRPAFLLGETSTTGFRAYFPIALAVKTPLAVLLPAFVAIFALLADRRRRWRAAYLLAPPALFFLVATQSALNIGYRHLLPMLPFLAVLTAGLAARRNGGVVGRRLAIAGAGALLLTSLIAHPHYLSYFNQVAGGPAQGSTWLSDSNIDWGQDLIRLRVWQAANGEPLLKLSWFGTADPAYYGVLHEPLPGLPRHFDLWWDPPFDREQPEPGVYAISVSNLAEPPLLPAEKTVYAWFRARKPDARVGYSIHIFRVP